jgi:hypothetical protein
MISAQANPRLFCLSATSFTDMVWLTKPSAVRAEAKGRNFHLSTARLRKYAELILLASMVNPVQETRLSASHDPRFIIQSANNSKSRQYSVMDGIRASSIRNDGGT